MSFNVLDISTIGRKQNPREYNQVTSNFLVEIRLDAYKLLALTRRGAPIPLRKATPWAELVGVMSKVAILTNAFLIALTTNFIPRVVFMFGYGDDYTLNGFVEFILSEFNTTDW